MASGSAVEEMLPEQHQVSATANEESNLEQMELEHDQLPPADHGKKAYLVLAACTIIQAPVWGKVY